jgi:hypothetical protein
VGRKGKIASGENNHHTDMDCGMPCPECGCTEVYLKAMPPGHAGPAMHELLHFSVPNHGRLWKSLMRAHLGDYEHLELRLRKAS